MTSTILFSLLKGPCQREESTRRLLSFFCQSTYFLHIYFPFFLLPIFSLLVISANVIMAKVFCTSRLLLESPKKNTFFVVYLHYSLTAFQVEPFFFLLTWCVISLLTSFTCRHPDCLLLKNLRGDPDFGRALAALRFNNQTAFSFLSVWPWRALLPFLFPRCLPDVSLTLEKRKKFHNSVRRAHFWSPSRPGRIWAHLSFAFHNFKYEF